MGTRGQQCDMRPRCQGWGAMAEVAYLSQKGGSGVAQTASRFYKAGVIGPGTDTLETTHMLGPPVALRDSPDRGGGATGSGKGGMGARSPQLSGRKKRKGKEYLFTSASLWPHYPSIKQNHHNAASQGGTTEATSQLSKSSSKGTEPARVVHSHHPSTPGG